MKKWCLKVVGGLAVAVTLLNLVLVPSAQARVSEPWNEPPPGQQQERQGCGCGKSCTNHGHFLEGITNGGSSTAPSFLPDDLVVEPIKGEKASNIIASVMEKADGLALRGALPSFHPVPNEARVTSAVWAEGTQQAIIVAIHFTNHHGEGAILQQITLNGTVESITMVRIPDNLDTTKAKIYKIVNKQVDVINLGAMSSGFANATSTSCTRDLMISCLQQYGCSGWTLVACITALLTCPFTLWGCVAAYACTLYCGGAWSNCWCLLCGC